SLSSLLAFVVALLVCISPFFCNAAAPSEIYTLSLHDALPIYAPEPAVHGAMGVDETHAARPDEPAQADDGADVCRAPHPDGLDRSEEHTSELQSRVDLVCRLLLEKKNTNSTAHAEAASDHRGE